MLTSWARAAAARSSRFIAARVQRTTGRVALGHKAVLALLAAAGRVRVDAGLLANRAVRDGGALRAGGQWQ